jgi:hypothetical protein
MPIAEISAALSGFGHLISLTKSLTEVVKATGKVESINLVIELQSSVMDLQQKAWDLADKNRQLQGELEVLQAKITERAKIIYDHDAYWSEKTDGGLIGPYSVELYDKDSKLILMRSRGPANGSAAAGQQISFQCAETHRTATVPVGFLRDHRVWGEAQIEKALIPRPSPVQAFVRRHNRSML